MLMRHTGDGKRGGTCQKVPQTPGLEEFGDVFMMGSALDQRVMRWGRVTLGRGTT